LKISIFDPFPFMRGHFEMFTGVDQERCPKERWLGQPLKSSRRLGSRRSLFASSTSARIFDDNAKAEQGNSSGAAPLSDRRRIDR
jgi:hypothetical protein